MTGSGFAEIVEDFEFLDEWQDRYRYVIDLGNRMVPLPEAVRIPATKVEGCASQVWLLPKLLREGDRTVFTFEGDSDAMIVRGLIAILKALYNGVMLEDVPYVDAEAELGRLGLREHLTAQRSNGLTAMVRRIQNLAAAASQSDPA
ncbi:MAG: SufE family protein [Rhodobacteraceae bacterium]|nr:SufE family protein [Paracoccaceae bacterium]